MRKHYCLWSISWIWSLFKSLKTQPWFFLVPCQFRQIGKSARLQPTLRSVLTYVVFRKETTRFAQLSGGNQHEKWRSGLCMWGSHSEPNWENQNGKLCWVRKRCNFFANKWEFEQMGRMSPNSLSQKRKWDPICSRAYCTSKSGVFVPQSVGQPLI